MSEKEQSANNKLTFKQKAFVNAYLSEARGNATEAAKLAGYSAKKRETLAEIGSENLRKPEIAEAIKERVSELAMSADEVLARLTDMARGNMADFVEGNHWGGRPVITFDEATMKAHGHIIKRFKVGKGEVEIELYDAQAALALIGKYHGLFVERKDITSGGQPLSKVYVDVDMDKI